MNFRITKILAKDLLQEKSQYIKDGQLIFNRVTINSYGANDCTIDLYYDTCHLASIKADGCPGPFMKFNFQLNDSNMKLHFEDKDVYSPPESTILEKAKKAVAKAMKDLEAL
jgi:hypothetical protein